MPTILNNNQITSICEAFNNRIDSLFVQESNIIALSKDEDFKVIKKHFFTKINALKKAIKILSESKNSLEPWLSISFSELMQCVSAIDEKLEKYTALKEQAFLMQSSLEGVDLSETIASINTLHDDLFDAKEIICEYYNLNKS